jgi:hypothetical protein
MLAFRRAKQLSSMGWDGFQCFDMWVASTKNFASKEEMGEKFVLSLEEELGYEKIVTNLE